MRAIEQKREKEISLCNLGSPFYTSFVLRSHNTTSGSSGGSVPLFSALVLVHVLVICWSPSLSLDSGAGT